MSAAASRPRFSAQGRHILIGAATLVIVAWALGASYVSGRPGVATDGMMLKAEFDTVQGLAVGAPVMLAGLPIGEVAAMAYDPDRRLVSVTLSVDRQAEIPMDSVASVVSEGMFAGKYLRISPGGDFETLGDGDYFEYVQNAVDFETLILKVIQRAEEEREAASD